MPLSNSQYETIIREYQQTLDANRYELERRKEQIYQVLPEYWDLEDSISSLSASAARSMLEGDYSARDTLGDRLKEIKNHQAALLASAGFPEDYLEPIYHCPLCRDTGYVTTEYHTKEKCQCFRQKEIALLYSQSNIREVIAHENFSSLSYEYYQGEDLQRFRTAVKLSKDFVENFNQDYRNILFYGTVGTGKSFLSGCIARELIDAGYSVIYFSASVLFETLTGFAQDFAGKKALSELNEDIYNSDLLIIDDLGTELPNALRNAQLFACLNERYLRKKSTIISTNLGLEELQTNYSDRIFSRFTSYFDLCKLTGPDIRMQRKRLANACAKEYI